MVYFSKQDKTELLMPSERKNETVTILHRVMEVNLKLRIHDLEDLHFLHLPYTVCFVCVYSVCVNV